jgi:hypothetical protein
MPEKSIAPVRGNAIAAESGYSAPYLYLLREEERPSITRTGPSAYTRKKLNSIARAIQSGYGQGRGDYYRPWIRIRRNFSSPVSHQVFDSVGIHTRNHHFLSTLEFNTALMVSYLCALELRECLPLWPFEHSHPGGHPISEHDGRRETVPGLLTIAKAAGIDHGCYVGTTVPYVASIDLMFYLECLGGTQLLGISCKPGEIAIASKRAQERIELDRLYCAAIGARHIHEDGINHSQELIKQLKWMRPLVADLHAHKGTSRLADFCCTFDELAADRPVSDAACAAGKKVGLHNDGAHMFFRLGVWLHKIDVDLTQRVQMRSMVKRGQATVLEMLKGRYLGGAA